MGSKKGTAWTFAAALALAGCDLALPPNPALNPPAPEPVEVSAQSKELSKYYRGVQQALLVQGLLRTDGGGPDTPFQKRQLVENFTQIAAFDEFTNVDGAYLASNAPSTVRKWQKPVRVKVHYGPAVPDAIKRNDDSFVARYASRLARVTGHRISTVSSRANFNVLLMTVDGLQTAAPLIKTWIPGIDDESVRQMLNRPRTDYCAVYTFSNAGTPNQLEQAIAIIPAEHPELMRQLCYHEEIAQGLGLFDDSPRARPSIFNDDSEFAYLTRHDELLLQILYDSRMPVGLPPETARAVTEVIAAELLGAES